MDPIRSVLSAVICFFAGIATHTGFSSGPDSGWIPYGLILFLIGLILAGLQGD